jgi:hypothetical protein
VGGRERIGWLLATLIEFVNEPTLPAVLVPSKCASDERRTHEVILVKTCRQENSRKYFGRFVGYPLPSDYLVVVDEVEKG